MVRWAGIPQFLEGFAARAFSECSLAKFAVRCRCPSEP
jgi:hypothetical protein